MRAPPESPKSLSPIIALLLQGQSPQCVQAFTRLEQAIWTCVGERVPAAEVGLRIASATGTACAMCAKAAKGSLHPALCRLDQAIKDCMDSIKGGSCVPLVSAFADDVLRVSANLWHSWQDGYDAGWEDARALSAEEQLGAEESGDRARSASWLDS